MQRRRSPQQAFADRLAAEKAALEAKAAELTHGPGKEELLKKVRQLETAARMDEWLTSPGLRPPG